ncbi:MAG TPA: hypothetical protein VGL28_02580 [Steroidobacteraceae bacterium]|jgi:hypothetical protein
MSLAERARRTLSQHAVETEFTTALLMEYSQHFLLRAAEDEASPRSQIAQRMLRDKPLRYRWQHLHGQLMHGVVVPPPAQRAVELRKVALLTLHRKAPFEYLRDRRVIGQARRQLVSTLFGAQDYVRCLVREHTAFLNSACSFLCINALCGEVLGDAAFSQALSHYESAYTEYFQAYGDSLLAQQRGEVAPAESLLPYLRYQLKLIREHMLAGNPQQSDFTALQALYEPSGDTRVRPVISGD